MKIKKIETLEKKKQIKKILMDYFGSLRKFRNVPLIAIFTLSIAGIYGLYHCFTTPEPFPALMLWGLGLAFYLPYEKMRFMLLRESYHKSYYISLCAIFLSVIFSYYNYTSIGLTLIFLAPILYFGRRLAVFAEASAVLVWTIAVPNIEYLHHLISYPMRLFVANISSVILVVFGFDAVANSTVVNIEGSDIAITSACSGIEQLESMILVAWIISCIMHAKLQYRIIHFICILPTIILVNSLRLTVTLIGFKRYGEFFLSNFIHSALGFLTIILIVVLFILIGYVFVEDDTKVDRIEDE